MSFDVKIKGHDVSLDIGHRNIDEETIKNIQVAIEAGQPFGLKGRNASVIFDPANFRSIKIGGIINRPNSITIYPGLLEMFAAISLNLFGKKEFMPSTVLVEHGVMKYLPVLQK